MKRPGNAGLPAHFQTGNVLDLAGHASNSFDIVLDGHCCHCIIGPDRTQFLRETVRVLKPAGVFHLNTMCGDPGCEEYRRQFDLPSRCLIRDGIAVRQLNLPDDIEREITGAGFTVLSTRVLQRRNDRELDLLLLDATKP